MRVGAMAAILAAALSGCGEIGAAPGDRADAADSGEKFPVKGEYHRTSDRTVGGQLQRLETDGPLAASTREEFEQLVAGTDIDSCRDRQVDIGSGSFSVKMTCDGGSYGEYTLGRQGSYSKNSIDMTYERTSDGTTATETVSYRLKS